MSNWMEKQNVPHGYECCGNCICFDVKKDYCKADNKKTDINNNCDKWISIWESD